MFDYDFKIEFENGTIVWIKDKQIVDANDMLEVKEVNIILERLLSEYK